MTFHLPKKNSRRIFYKKVKKEVYQPHPLKKTWSFLTLSLSFFCLLLIFVTNYQPAYNLISPIVDSLRPLHPLKEGKNTKEVFGFAPYWKFTELDDVNFDVLTTFAYFGVPVLADGTLDTADIGYETFQSQKATELFKKAHREGTRVVLTVTQMDNDQITALLDNPQAQKTAVSEIVNVVKQRGIDGVNVDFEYTGNPGSEYRSTFSGFIRSLTERMHQEVPSSRVSVSVYALAARDKKLYDIKELGAVADSVFMMAYDFAVSGSDYAAPTAPLYGYKEGKYIYDISTAVKDFLTLMPAEKLILGVPYYSYNYLVYEPAINAETRPFWSWRGQPATQTYDIVQANVTANELGKNGYKEGWDDAGKVGWRAYYVPETDTWRMVFVDDYRSLGLKYDFAKDMNLGGIGMWALGFDHGRSELWDLLKEKFGNKFADSSVLARQIKGI